MRTHLPSIFAAGILLAGLTPNAVVLAGTPVRSSNKDKNVEVEPPPAESRSRWSIGAGVTYRQINADFDLHPAGGPVGFSRNRSGRGDVGLQSGGADVRVYDDGLVGPGYGFGDGNSPDGTAYTVINSPGQISSTGRTGFDEDEPFPIYEVRFHSHRASNFSEYKSQDFHDSDSEDVFGPYLELRYAAYQGDDLDVNVLFGYSYVSGDLSSGKGLLAMQTVNRRTDRYTYVYDYDAEEAGVFDPGAEFPFVDEAYSIIDPNGDYAGGPEFLAPRKSKNSSNRKVASYYQVGQAKVDVDLHELVLAPEVFFNTGRFHIGVAAGPTVNFVNTDFDATAAWYRSGSSRPIRSYHVSESSNDVEIGAMCQLSVQVDVTECIFVQASGSYRFVPTVDVGSGFAESEVDASSATGSLGIGVRF